MGLLLFHQGEKSSLLQKSLRKSIKFCLFCLEERKKKKKKKKKQLSRHSFYFFFPSLSSRPQRKKKRGEKMEVTKRSRGRLDVSLEARAQKKSRISFYRDPPYTELTLDQFETFALHRLEGMFVLLFCHSKAYSAHICYMLCFICMLCIP